MADKRQINAAIKVAVFLLFAILYFAGILISTAYFYGNIIIPVVIVITLFVLEKLILKKFDIGTALLSCSVVLSLLVSMILLTIYPADLLEFVQLMAICCGLRAFLAITDLIKAKAYKLIPVCSVLIIGFVCLGYYGNDLYYSYYNNLGQPDLTGQSWSAINQEIGKDDDWQQIVTQTSFYLGDIRETLHADGSPMYICDAENYPSMDGSTVCVPMAMEFARQHLKIDEDWVADFANFSTTHYAYENLINNNPTSYSMVIPYDNKEVYFNLRGVDLVLATEPSDEELALAQSKGVTLIKKPVCYDAFVFITHKDNPVSSLTVEQIRDIYSGKIKNWKEVGGKDEKIRAFQREANSGSQTAMENLVMQGSDMIDPIEIPVVIGMGGLVDMVAEYENETASIGYTYRYYIDTLYKNDNIKTIAIEGIAPTDVNIRNKRYPFTTNYYGVIRQEDQDKTAGKFLNWILSDEGQKCVEQAGYITME